MTSKKTMPANPDNSEIAASISPNPDSGENTVKVMRMSEIQQEVAELLATGHTTREIASMMGLSELTIARWRQQPEFFAAVNNLLKHNDSALRERLYNLAIKAMEVLEAVIDDPNTSAVDKIDAAAKVLELVTLKGEGGFSSKSNGAKAATSSKPPHPPLMKN
ncbi:MAG: hypothetical protein GDA56_21810 [Hormoscilla sp. GM7CHS1pb]|nr:hypothetical protein [Hormoscilla sp. GM7CHS1pb]